MKKILMFLVVITMTTAAFAQFEEGTKYAGVSLSGFNLSYSGAEKLRMDISAKGGYFFRDCVAGIAEIGWDTNVKDQPAMFFAAIQGRYYLISNGLYGGVGLRYETMPDYSNLLPGLEVGYTYYLNHYIAVEPAVYYNQSFISGGRSKIGLRIGASVYF